MDKKSKKRLDVLRQKIQKNEQLLTAARQQPDEPDEIQQFEKQLATYKAEVEKLKKEG